MKRRTYTDDDYNTVKYLARAGASREFIAGRLDVNQKTILSNQKFRKIYKDNKREAFVEFATSYHQQACDGKHPAITIHYARCIGYTKKDFVDVDLNKYDTFAEKCSALDTALKNKKITLNQYKTLNDVLVKRYEDIELAFEIKIIREKLDGLKNEI